MELFELQVPRTIRISPDNQQVLYSTTTPTGNRTSEHELSTLWLAKTGHPNSARQVTSGDFNDHHPRWSLDGQRVAFISDRAKRGEQWAIYSVPTDTEEEPAALTPVENEQKIGRFAFSPDRKNIAYLSADEKSEEQRRKEKEKDDAKVYGKDSPFHRLRLVEIATRKVTTLVSRMSHITEFAFNDDGSKIAVLKAREPTEDSVRLHGSKLSIVDVTTSELQDVTNFPRQLSGLQWTGDSLYAISKHDTSSVVAGNAVYSFDLAKSDSKWRLCAHGVEDCPQELSKADRDVTVRVQHDLEDQLRMLDGSTIFSRPKAIKAWDASFSTDSDEVIVAVAQGDVNTPSEVYTTTASGGALVKLSNHGHALEGKQFGVQEFLKCASTDGEIELNAVWTTPTTHAEDDDTAKPSKPLPTVLFVHGGPYDRSTNTFDDGYMWVPLLLDAGYAVLQPNYRGGSGRGNAFAAVCRGACGVKDYEDVITLTQHAVELGYADPEKLVISGWSQGGFHAYMAAARNGRHGYGWRFKGAIAGAGVSDWDTLTMTSDMPTFESGLTGKAPWKCAKGDTSGRSGSALWEFKDAAEGSVIPRMLILHGEKDERVPIEQAVGFRRALESAELPFEMVVYPREGHVFKERKHLIDMGGRVVRFVGECLNE